MRTDIVFTLTGPDRVGIVEEVTGVLLGLDGNVETSRMARLGGEFAIIMQASVPDEFVEQIQEAFAHLVAHGYKVTVSKAAQSYADSHVEWCSYRIAVEGADHEGIVHEVAQRLAALGISIESMETATVSAPVSGVALFMMSALIVVPPELSEHEWIDALEAAGNQSNVEVTVARVECPE